MASGGLEVIESEEIRVAVTRYAQERPRLELLENGSLRAWADGIGPYLVENAPTFIGREVDPSEVDRVMADPSFRALLRLRRGAVRSAGQYRERTERVIDDLIRLLQEEVGDS